MPTQSLPKFRLLVVVLAVACLLGVLVAFKALKPDFEGEVPPFEVAEVPIAKVADTKVIKAKVPSVKVSETDTEASEAYDSQLQKNWGPGKDHPIPEPTDFYAASPDAPDVEANLEIAYTEHQVGIETTLLLYILHDADLLANHCLIECRDFITEQQMLEAKLLAKEYDPKLKEIRRQRAAVLEQAGVTIDDPEKELALIRVKAFTVMFEARRRIVREILSADQRKLIYQKYLEKQAEAQRVKEAKQAAEKNKVSQQ